MFAHCCRGITDGKWALDRPVILQIISKYILSQRNFDRTMIFIIKKYIIVGPRYTVPSHLLCVPCIRLILTTSAINYSGRASELGGIINLADQRRSSLPRSERPPFSC